MIFPRLYRSDQDKIGLGGQFRVFIFHRPACSQRRGKMLNLKGRKSGLAVGVFGDDAFAHSLRCRDDRLGVANDGLHAEIETIFISGSEIFRMIERQEIVHEKSRNNIGTAVQPIKETMKLETALRDIEINGVFRRLTRKIIDNAHRALIEISAPAFIDALLAKLRRRASIRRAPVKVPLIQARKSSQTGSAAGFSTSPTFRLKRSTNRRTRAASKTCGERQP